ncbi:MAG TPA: MBL fold metallo-hydrolase [Pseudomonadales bacterium]|nr:MBL fold metallo-hydrolase [Pseudomonadales bacterium]
MAQLTFLGAIGEVTGSRYLIETENARVLMECGLRQGSPRAERANRRSLRRLATGLDAVVLSHGHLDHAGLLPKLVRDGFGGPIFCTTGTRELLDIMFRDAAGLMARDVEWENRRRERAGRPLVEPVYTLEDVEQTLKQCRPIHLGSNEEVVEGMRVTFFDAGHILGSAIVELLIEDAGRRRHLVFSGDLGNPDSALMRDPTRMQEADVVLMESTYGDREHRPMDETVEQLAQILASAERGGGNVLIPAFAVGRTQEILYHLSLLQQAGRLPQQKVFLDSPMAIRVTELYDRRPDLLDDADLGALPVAADGDLARALPQLELTRDVEDSMAINRIKGGAIIIAGSGMCTGGRIRHHLKYNLWREQNHVVIVGFQAGGTLGRLLVDGVRRVKLFGEQIAVKAQIHTLGGFSAHAGQAQLLDWARAFHGRPAFHLVHGEPEAREALAAALKRECGIDAHTPAYEETIEL